MLLLIYLCSLFTQQSLMKPNGPSVLLATQVLLPNYKPVHAIVVELWLWPITNVVHVSALQFLSYFTPP